MKLSAFSVNPLLIPNLSLHLMPASRFDVLLVSYSEVNILKATIHFGIC